MNALSDNWHWRHLTLPGQFLLAGAIVMTIAMVIVGNWVSQRIEDAVVQNSATTAALFMESFISPISQELAQTETLSQPAKQALSEIFHGTSLGERVVSYKIWLPGGRLVHASDPALIGQVFEPSEDLNSAMSGAIAWSFEDLDDLENEAEAALGVPLLEVYSPIRQAWTGDVIAVAEFYERAEGLAADIQSARRTSWIVVGGTFLASGVILFGIVQAGGRTIRRQRLALEQQLTTTTNISNQNAALHKRVVTASSQATEQTERTLRRIGFDLHDGPAQYLSLAALRLDAALGRNPTTDEDVTQVRGSLSKALDELRIISRGLALPDLDEIDFFALVNRAIGDHQKQTGMQIDLNIDADNEPALDYAQKLCVFRFLQETLSNATRHADVKKAYVIISQTDSVISLEVCDHGLGFDVTQRANVRQDGGQGLFGLVARAESIGGGVTIQSKPSEGSSVTLTLPREEKMI